MKFRISSFGVNDVGGMSLHSMIDTIPDFYIVCIGNSSFASRYTESYVNFTVNFQINDARLLPIVIPTKDELILFKNLFDNAINIRKQQFSSAISQEIAEEKLNIIQQRLELMVNELYGV